MYIKFCRSYGEDKKDEASAGLSPESKLSVEVEGEKGKLTEGNKRLYRAACLFLTIICLALLLVVIILGVKLQTGSMLCPVREEAGEVKRPNSVVQTCNYEQCQAHFPNTKCRRCQQCPKGWLTFGRSCFFLSTFRMSWDESQKNCSAEGGSLVVIGSPRIQHFLTKVGKLNYWIGLRQNKDAWTWINKTVLQESYWAEATPEGDCGILSSENPPDKNWFAHPCHAYTYFICQQEL